MILIKNKKQKTMGRDKQDSSRNFRSKSLNNLRRCFACRPSGQVNIGSIWECICTEVNLLLFFKIKLFCFQIILIC